MGRCDFVHVNRAGGGGGYRWLVTALSPGCGGQSLVITELLCECPICYHLHRQCLCPSELVNSCFCAFINVKATITKPIVSTDLISYVAASKQLNEKQLYQYQQCV